MSVGSVARNCGNLQTQPIPAVAEIQTAIEGVWMKILQETPSAVPDPNDKKIVIDSAAFEDCLRLLLSEAETPADEVMLMPPPQEASRQPLRFRLAFTAAA